MTSTTAARAVRSIRNDRVAPVPIEMKSQVRRNETVRDGFEFHDEGPTAETAVIDPVTGRFYELTARQMTAIHLLTMGKSVVATAKSLEIGVSTLHRWKSKQPAFVAELNRRQHEVFERTVDKLRQTMSKAVEELFNLMQSNSRRERYEVAMKLLPMMQPRKWIIPTGPRDPDAVVDEQIREKRTANGEAATAEITEAEREAAIEEAEYAISGTGIPACATSTPTDAERPDDQGLGATGRGTPRPVREPGEPRGHRSASTPTCGTHTSDSEPEKPLDPAPRNARTHAERVSVRPVDSSESGGDDHADQAITA
jgi:hypothetical protein